MMERTRNLTSVVHGGWQDEELEENIEQTCTKWVLKQGEELIGNEQMLFLY